MYALTLITDSRRTRADPGTFATDDAWEISSPYPAERVVGVAPEVVDVDEVDGDVEPLVPDVLLVPEVLEVLEVLLVPEVLEVLGVDTFNALLLLDSWPAALTADTWILPVCPDSITTSPEFVELDPSKLPFKYR